MMPAPLQQRDERSFPRLYHHQPGANEKRLSPGREKWYKRSGWTIASNPVVSDFYRL
jgi:hypothetical protein